MLLHAFVTQRTEICVKARGRNSVWVFSNTTKCAQHILLPGLWLRAFIGLCNFWMQTWTYAERKHGS